MVHESIWHAALGTCNAWAESTASYTYCHHLKWCISDFRVEVEVPLVSLHLQKPTV